MEHKKRYYEQVSATIIKNLEKRQISGIYCPDCESAVAEILRLIPEHAKIGWGGSMTLQESGIMVALQNGPYTLLDRDSAKDPIEQKEIYQKIFSCDYFLMSTNAITLDGELVNIDSRGNRVSFLCFGPEHVLIVAGINKLVPDVEAGIQRTRNIAAPPNTLRLGRNTPCSVTGQCADCLSPDCICGQTVVTRRSAVPGRITVLLIGESLGY